MAAKVVVDSELCIGCESCIEHCPIDGANVLYQDDSGSNKVRIDETKCAVCGRCISTCPTGARSYQ